MSWFSVLVLAITVLPFHASAASPDPMQLAKDYFNSPPEITPAKIAVCVENPQPCMQYCTERSGVTDKQSILDFVKSCKGNEGNLCVKYIAERTGFTDKISMIEIAVACRGNADSSCVKYAADRAGATDRPTLLDFARACGSFYSN